MKSRTKEAQAVRNKLQQEEDGYSCAAAALWDMLHRRCLLPELVFFVRFFANVGISNVDRSKLFMVTDSEMAMFAEDAGLRGEEARERAWRMVLESRLSEWTGCGHFASVMRHNVYFANAAEEAAAVSLELVSPRDLLNHLAHVERREENGTPREMEKEIDEQGMIIRVEFSAYSADEWNQAVGGKGGKPDAHDFHAYLIDIPFLPLVMEPDDEEGDQQQPAAYIVQSLWEHYDVSVRPISSADLHRHLRFLALLDGRTRMTDSQRCRFTHPSFWDVPLPRLGSPVSSSVHSMGDYLGPSLDLLLTRLEAGGKRRVENEDDRISVLDVFSVASYDREQCKRRLASHLEDAFDDGDNALEYGWDDQRTSAPNDKRLWHEVLDAVVRVHEETEKKHTRKGRKGGRTLPLVDFLPSPTPDRKKAKGGSKSERMRKAWCILS